MLNRRKCLAAVSAAIATPAGAWRDHWNAEKEAKGDVPLTPDLGLTPLQAEVRAALRSRILDTIENLINEPGHAAMVDLWLLSESLIDYTSGPYNGQFAGLFNAIEERLGRERRFVAVPEAIHEDVQAFIETLKAARSGTSVESSASPQSTQPENVVTFPGADTKSRSLQEIAEIRDMLDQRARKLIDGA